MTSALLLLVVDPRAADLEAVRATADQRGWDLVVEALDGSAPPPDDGRWFAVPLRLRVTARAGAEAPDARALLRVSPGLAPDETRRLDS